MLDILSQEWRRILLNERQEVARPFAKKIGAVEASLNQALVLIGEILTEIPEERSKLAEFIPLETGVAATENLAEAVSLVARSYRHVVEARCIWFADCRAW